MDQAFDHVEGQPQVVNQLHGLRCCCPWDVGRMASSGARRPGGTFHEAGRVTVRRASEPTMNGLPWNELWLGVGMRDGLLCW